MARVLILRFSALGDVAMTVPVIHSLAVQYPNHRFVLLSRESYSPLFKLLPDNVHFLGADFKGKYKGIFGLTRLFRELYAQRFDRVADLHGVLRSFYLGFLFRLSGAAVITIDKGRVEKYNLTLREGKVLKPLRSSFQRYADVFDRLGLPVQWSFNSLFGSGKGPLSTVERFTGEKQGARWIGIAPFAKHPGKEYLLRFQEQVVAHFSRDSRVKVFLFGGGSRERVILEEWTHKYPGVVSVLGLLSMHEELVLMSHLNLMLTMDSANMHLASLVNTPVVSIWGATHPYAGFMGWNQTAEKSIQVDIECRPCSIFGDKPCFRRDHACMTRISPERVIRSVERILYASAR